MNSQLHEELKEHREDNNVLQREVKELRDIFLKKDARISTLEVQVNELHLKLDDQEQYSRRNNLRVTGVPENVNEDVGEKIVELCNAELNLGDVQVKPEHIDRVHRVGPRREGVSSRPILVKFATYRTRQLVYKKRSRLKLRNNTEAEEGDQNGRPNPIYINEDLTKYRSNLLWKARVKKKDKMINDCWSYDGNILIKDSKNKITTVHSLQDLEKAAC